MHISMLIANLESGNCTILLEDSHSLFNKRGCKFLILFRHLNSVWSCSQVYVVRVYQSPPLSLIWKK